MQPQNYMLQQPQQNIMTGVQQGITLSNIMDKATQEQAVKESQVAMQRELAELAYKPNPTAEDYSTMMTKYPSLSEQLKRSFDVLSEGQKKTSITEASQVHSAISSGRTDIALDILEKKKEAAVNSGNKEEENKANIAIQLVKTNPEAAKTSMAMMLSVADPDKFAENLTKIQGEKREEALFPSEAELKKQEIETKKLDRQVKVAETAIKKADSETKRQEIQFKIDELQKKREDITRENAAKAESGMASIDNMLNSTERFFNTADDIIASATGPIESRMPTLSEDTADFEELVETMGSQAFMAMIPAMKGAGALSDAEGKKLATSMQSLSLRQSPERLKDNVKEIQRILTKARTALAKKHGVKETTPDTPAAELEQGEIDALLQKYGG